MKTLVQHMAIARCRHSVRRGFTLVELAASMTVMTILMGAMTSAIFIAGHAIPDSQDPELKKMEAMDVVDQIAGELFYATSISEATETAVTFTVADRGHGAAGPETIRYAWSGTPRDPLTRQYNGGTVVKVCEDVQLFKLVYDKRVGQLEGLPKVLFLVDEAGSLLADEAARQTAMEGWGFTVQPISSWRSEAEFKVAAANNDVVYIPSPSVLAGDVAPKLTNCSLGIVNEVTALFADVGVSKVGTFHLDTHLDILNNAHEITSVFPTGPVQIFSLAENLAISTQAVSAGTQVLAQANTYATLLVIDIGGELYGGGTANTRRVCLPWAGWKTFDFNNVNAGGLTLMRRAIAWAAAPSSYTTVEIVLQPTEDPEQLGTEVQVFNMPRVNAP